MHELKHLSLEAVPKALERADRYRLLNDPGVAESICIDVLRVEPGNRQAIVMLLLALTEQLEQERGAALGRARELLPRFADEYSRAYYAGIICERWAKANLKRAVPSSRAAAHQALTEAMSWFEKAEALRQPGNDEALLHWNTCARIMARHELVASVEERTEHQLE